MNMSKYTFMIDHAKGTIDEAKDYYKDYVYNKDTNPTVAKLYMTLGQKHMSIFKDIMSAMSNELMMDKNKDKSIDDETIAYLDYEKKKLNEKYDMCSYKYSML